MMTRLEALEKVLSAAGAVLAAREDQMLTHVEWDALQLAVAEANTEMAAIEPTDKIRVQILFEDGMIFVWDDDGDGIDCHELGTGAPNEVRLEAERQIDRWADKYEFDVADVKRRLLDYLSE